MKRFFWLLSWLVHVPFLSAQTSVVTWELTPEKYRVSAGNEVRIQIIGHIEEGWHVYAMGSPAGRPLSVKFTKLPSFFVQKGGFVQRGEEKMYDPNFESDVLQWDKTAYIEGILHIAPDAPVGIQALSAEVAFMSCDDRICLPVKKILLMTNVEVIPPPSLNTENKAPDRNLTLSDTLKNPLPVPEIRWTWQLANTSVARGGLLQMDFSAMIPENWKLYTPDSPAGNPLRLELSQPKGAKVEGALRPLGGIEAYDAVFKSKVHQWTEQAQFMAFFRIPNEAEGDVHLIGKIKYMICSATVCVPRQSSFSASLPINRKKGTALGEGADENQGGGSGVMATDALKEAKSGGLWAFLLLAIGAALAALLTPCVFPMIPLTVSYFTHRTQNPIRSALVYGFAIVGTFTGLGLLMAAISGAAGAQTIAANPWVNLFIGVVFMLFAFSLLGFYELTIPNGLLNYFNQKGDENKGYLGLIFMGFTLTLVSFSCTVPFVGGLLAATTQGSWSWPILGMLAFSITFALPFVLFAMFPHWLSALPKSGSWMNTVKVVLGFVELAAAIKFFSNADLVLGTFWLSRPLAIVLAGIVFLLTALFLMGWLRLPHAQVGERISPFRWVGALAFAGLSVYLFSGINGTPLPIFDPYLPPAFVATQKTATTTKTASLEDVHGWIGNDRHPAEKAKSEAFRLAKTTGKPVFIDFTGYTCTNCRQMEASVFPQPAVEKRFKEKYVLLRLYTDDDAEGPMMQQYQLAMTGTVALPTYAIVTPDGKLLRQWSGLADLDTFVAFLDGTPLRSS